MLISAVFACCKADNIEDEKKDYSGYQVLKIPPGLDRITIAFLSKRELRLNKNIQFLRNYKIYFIPWY